MFEVETKEEISRLYYELQYEYILVQENLTETPTIPSLTPAGFTTWIVLQIVAHPQKEWRRLTKVLTNMPIEADGVLVEDRPERFPKQMPRRLFPERENTIIKESLDQVIDNVSRNLSSTTVGL